MNSPSSSTSKTSQNGSGVPQWLEELKVKKGRWYSSSKARPERLMQISLTADAQKVHACLELGSMAYQREDAVCTVKDGSAGGKQVWLTPGKIAKLTAISKEHVLRALKDLEYYGLAERFLIDPARGEVKGNVGVRSWALPRPVQEGEKREPRAATISDLGAEYKTLISFAKRFRIDLEPDKWGESRGSLLQAALAAVAKVEEAEKEAVALLKGFGAPSRIYKEERNGKELERNPPPPQPFVNGSNGHQEEEDKPSEPIETPTPQPRPPDLYDEFKAAYPKDRFDEAKVKPLFRALPRPVQQRAIARLRERYLTCERWLDEGGKWIPFASKWLVEKQYDADPPPKWSKQQQSRGKQLAPIDDVLALMRRNREGT